MPESQKELSQADSFDPEEDESTSVEVRGKPGPKSAAAFREQQSRADQAELRAQRLEQRLQQLESHAQASARQAEESEFLRQLSAYPEDQQQQALANRRWQQLQQALAQEQRARQQAETFVSQAGAIAKASELVAEHYLPKTVYGVPTIRFLLGHAQTPEAMESLAKEIAAERGEKAPTSKEAAPKRGSRYAGGEGSTAPRVPLHQRTPEEQAKIFKQLTQGKLRERDLGRI